MRSPPRCAQELYCWSPSTPLRANTFRLPTTCWPCAPHSTRCCVGKGLLTGDQLEPDPARHPVARRRHRRCGRTGETREDHREVELDVMVQQARRRAVPGTRDRADPGFALAKVSPAASIDTYYRAGRRVVRRGLPCRPAEGQRAPSTAKVTSAAQYSGLAVTSPSRHRRICSRCQRFTALPASALLVRAVDGDDHVGHRITVGSTAVGANCR